MLSDYKQFQNLIYLILIFFAVYFSHIIYGNIILTILLFYFFYRFASELNTIYFFSILFIVFVVLYFANIDKSFLLGYPILLLFINKQNTNSFLKILFLNTILFTCIIENIYYTGINTYFLYFFWGLPILFLSVLLTKVKPILTNIIFSIILISLMFGQIVFNIKNQDKAIYTYSDNNNIVANVKILGKYFKNVNNNYNNTEISRNSTIILPVAENKIEKNVIVKGNNYIILGEHDNLNGFVQDYPYINNDAFFRRTPWHIYSPNISGYFKYFLNKDIFYCSNIGSTVNAGSPILWEYSKLGKPIMLASFAKINNANVFIFGDSDFMVNKLMPYNINFIAGLLQKGLNLYPVFVILFAFCNFLIIKHRKYQALIIFFLMIIAYFLPLRNAYNAELKIYSQVKYITAHISSYPSSILNFLAKENIAVATSNQRKAQIQIINKKEKWNNIKTSSLIYILSNASISSDRETIYCSDIKLGDENLNNKKIIDSRLFVINGKLSKSGYYKSANIEFICTGSPQLNYKLSEKVVENDK